MISFHNNRINWSFDQNLYCWAYTKNTSGRNTHDQVADSLNTSGIYSIVRHPLYVGNF